MKNLKVKSILFSLLAMMAVAVFMTSCEQTKDELDYLNLTESEALDEHINEPRDNNVISRSNINLSISTQNVGWLPWPASCDFCSSQQVGEMTDYLLAKNSKVYGVQEAFRNNPRINFNNTFSRYWNGFYWVDRFYHTNLDKAKDHGLIIYSEYPIVREFHGYFTECNGFSESTGADCWREKGWVYVEVMVGDSRIGIINTHLDAGSHSEDKRVRRTQMNQINTFIFNNVSNSTPVILMGDWNFDLSYHLPNPSGTAEAMDTNFPTNVAYIKSHGFWATFNPSFQSQSVAQDYTNKEQSSTLDAILIDTSRPLPVNYNTSNYTIDHTPLRLNYPNPESHAFSDHSTVTTSFSFVPPSNSYEEITSCVPYTYGAFCYRTGSSGTHDWIVNGNNYGSGTQSDFIPFCSTSTLVKIRNRITGEYDDQEPLCN